LYDFFGYDNEKTTLNVLFIYQLQMGTPLQNNIKNVTTVAENFKYKLLLDQSDMYSHILSKFPENTIEPKMIIWVLLEYIRYHKNCKW